MSLDREIKRAVDSIVVICDTREQDTQWLAQRLSTLGHTYRRETLESADYWVEYNVEPGVPVRLPVAIERKMSLDELVACFTTDRDRFQAEMERLKNGGIKTYLLIERANWEMVYKGDYRSAMTVQSFLGSLMWWAVHYDLRIVFCKAMTTGRLIGDILRYEVCEDVKRRHNDSHQG